MNQFRIVSISEEITEKVRTSLRSPQYGHPAHVEQASGFGPCRSCLGVFREGQEERILFTYNTFTGRSLTPLPGPVFVHGDRCARFTGAGFPADLETLDLLLDAYNSEGSVILSANPDRGGAEASINEILSDQAVMFINIRNAGAGCFVARVERGIGAI